MNNTKKEEFIFKAQPINIPPNEKEIIAIEYTLQEKGYIPEEYIETFLDWIIYSARKNVSSPLENIEEISMAGRCATTQRFIVTLLNRLKITNKPINVGTVFNTVTIHAITMVAIPTLINGEIIYKNYVLDPTFRQFCITEENRFERYYEEPRWGCRMSTPHPGYFLALTDEGTNFANNLIINGYFLATTENLKKYFDSFALYLTPKEEYDNEEEIGKKHTTSTTGHEYNLMIEKVEQNKIFGQEKIFETPKEKLEKQQKKLSYKIKKIFSKKEEPLQLISNHKKNKT